MVLENQGSAGQFVDLDFVSPISFTISSCGHLEYCRSLGMVILGKATSNYWSPPSRMMILHLCIHLVMLGLILRVNLVSFLEVLDSEYLLSLMHCLSKLMANSSSTSTPGAFFTYEFQVSSGLLQSDANRADLRSLLETVRVSYPDPSF